jgi:hypothetical protein
VVQGEDQATLGSLGSHFETPPNFNLVMPGARRHWQPSEVDGFGHGTRPAVARAEVQFRTVGGRRVLAVCLSLAVGISTPAEPGLIEAQDAAARVAGGLAAEDAARESRARAAHWAPQLRGQGGAHTSDENRTGVRYNAPLIEEDIGTGTTWSVLLSWDFAQVVFAREETQLALAHAHLSRIRRDARDKAAELWIDRKRELLLFGAMPFGSQRAAACFAALRLTAQLDAITGGLFRDALAKEEVVCAREGEKK